ncbi:sulfotransferase superfamily protein [Flammeovirgaceae bacterium 311]|nr:sulfotransferase superfamily protein [Flammeovirgaceae bacterium 311]
MRNVKYYYNKLNEKFIVQRAYFSKKASRPLNFFFIVSCGRSGTTLLRKLLMNSGVVHIPPETGDFIVQASQQYFQHRKKGWYVIVNSIVALVYTSNDFRYWNLDSEALKGYLLNIQESERTLQNLILGVYKYHQMLNSPNATLIGDKTPYLVLRLEWLKTLFPGAKIIHLVRDSRAVVNSRKSTLNESLEYAVNRWVWSVKEVFKYKKRLSLLEVKYEDLVNDPKSTLELISIYLEMNFTEQFFEDKKILLGDDIKPHHKKLNNPITSNEVNKWKSELTREEISYISTRTQKYLKIYNYPLDV